MYRHHFKGRRRNRTRQYIREQPVWPLPALDGHAPAIVEIDPVTREATLAYTRPPVEGAARAVTPPGHPFFMPDSTPVLAIKSGVVIGVCSRDGVHRVMLDHGNCFATDYDGLDETIACPPGSRRRVKAGEVIGTIRCPGATPRPLRFTLSRTDLIVGLPGFPRAVDPLDVLLGTVCIPVDPTTMPARKEAA